MLLNLTDHTMHALALDKLPGIDDDPLKAVREENAKAHPPANPASTANGSRDRRVRHEVERRQRRVATKRRVVSG